MIPFKPPGFKETAFNCPHCQAYARQIWQDILYRTPAVGTNEFHDLSRAQCSHCGKFTLWLSGILIYPEVSGVQPPNPDLREDIQQDYLEASSILNKSPRGAAALLRVCIQKLCIQLGERGENLNGDISNLVKRGLPPKIQQSLDIVRVIGNNAVHPGQIDLKDERVTATRLFELINLIADFMITQPKEVERLYGSLPESARQAIEERDKAGGS